MSITDELRGFVDGHLYLGATVLGGWKEVALAIADRIDAEHELAMAAAALITGIPITDEHMVEHGWIRLPKDADGEYIHIGDVMVYADGNTCPLPVVALVPPTVFLTDEGPRYADMCRHQPDTWERIIRDAIAEGMARELSNLNGGYDRSDSLSNASLVARCKTLANAGD